LQNNRNIPALFKLQDLTKVRQACLWFLFKGIRFWSADFWIGYDFP